ncbi:MAG: hypothetical protein J6T70_09785 [Bacteroidales bacterium]|nr:hypothetical protein [Bacteroidales bacterium]
MKKSVLLLFAAAMVAMTVFMSTSCSKDDSPEQQQTQDYGDPFGEGNPYSTLPRFLVEKWQGTHFDVKWTSAKYIDTTSFEYELFWCDLLKRTKDVYNPSISEMNSLGRQRDTVYHFSSDSELFESGHTYLIRLVTHYWYSNRECQIETPNAYPISFSTPLFDGVL